MKQNKTSNGLVNGPSTVTLTTWRRRASKRRRRKANPEQIAAGNAGYYRENQDRIKKWKRDDYAEHREERKAKRRAHYLAKRVRLRQHKWRREFIFKCGPICCHRQMYARYIREHSEQLRLAA